MKSYSKTREQPPRQGKSDSGEPKNTSGIELRKIFVSTRPTKPTISSSSNGPKRTNPVFPLKRSSGAGDWRIGFHPEVIHESDDLPESVKIEVADIIAELAQDPYAEKKLKYYRQYRYVRFHWDWWKPPRGKRRFVPLYRLIYRIIESRHAIMIRRVRHRGLDTYEGL